MGAARLAFAVVASLCIGLGPVAEGKQVMSSLVPEPVPRPLQQAQAQSQSQPQQQAEDQMAQLRQQFARTLGNGPASASLLSQSSSATQTSNANNAATSTAANTQNNGAGVDQARAFQQAFQQPAQFPPPGLQIAPTVPNLGLLDAGDQEEENCTPHCSSSEAQIAAQGTPPVPDASNRPPTKLELALSAIKDDILAKSRQVAAESAWVEQVDAITEQYRQKATRVKDNIVSLRKEVGGLYTKKKQIENLMLQKSLTQKLKEATGDLHTLQDALEHVATKQREFLDTKSNIETTITSLAGQLQTLKGATTGEAAQLGAADQEQRVASDIEQELRPVADSPL